MNKSMLALMTVFVAGALVGCNSSDATMTKSEMEALKHPSKTIPPEAAAAMGKYMGAGMAAQKERNKAAGVDGQGVPLSKSTNPSSGPPDATAPGGRESR